jgi:hypothetical protein
MLLGWSCLNYHLEDTISISGFDGEDAGVMKLDVMPQAVLQLG